MKKVILILFVAFAFIEGEAQNKQYAPGFHLTRSHRWGTFGISTSDTLFYTDSLRVNVYKPFKLGFYTTATAPPATAFPGCFIYNTDSLKPQWSNATVWVTIGPQGAGGGGSSYSFTSPLSESSGVVSIANAAADGSTKGAASFTAADFDATSGNIGIDYANGQMATGSVNGFMSTTTQTIAGAKTWSGNAVFNGTATFNGVTQIGGTVNGSLTIASSAASVRGGINLASNNPRLYSATGSLLLSNDGTNTNVNIGASAKNFFGGGSTPNAFVEILAGTATIPSLRFNLGVDQTTSLTGSFDYAAVSSINRLAFTPTGSTKKRVPLTNDAAPANGQIPIGNGTDYTVASIASADGTVTITNGAGTIDLKTTLTLSQSTYAATLTGTANVDAATVTGTNLYYTRIGNQITVRGVITVDPTTAGLTTTLRISLPVASALTASQQLSGGGNGSSIGATYGTILADATNDAAEFNFINGTATGSTTYTIWFTYEVL
jgi:hypothetical protein